MDQVLGIHSANGSRRLLAPEESAAITEMHLADIDLTNFLLMAWKNILRKHGRHPYLFERSSFLDPSGLAHLVDAG